MMSTENWSNTVKVKLVLIQKKLPRWKHIWNKSWELIKLIKLTLMSSRPKMKVNLFFQESVTGKMSWVLVLNKLLPRDKNSRKNIDLLTLWKIKIRILVSDFNAFITQFLKLKVLCKFLSWISLRKSATLELRLLMPRLLLVTIMMLSIELLLLLKDKVMKLSMSKSLMTMVGNQMRTSLSNSMEKMVRSSLEKTPGAELLLLMMISQDNLLSKRKRRLIAPLMINMHQLLLY